MTRINTNVSSLVAQKTLQRSNNQLQEALTRLSTGLAINVGKDDPAGLIASESLRSDIISVRKAITNSERANQLIATADSALGQVSSLLNDIRGLVSEAANTGALSSEQIGANQLQIDSSLEAIDRISQITTFQGKRLLDGTLDFITRGVGSDIQGLEITQANFGTLSEIGVSIDIVEQATRGQLTYAFDEIDEDVVLQIGGANGTEAFNFASGSSVDQIATAVNLVSDALGVTAEVIEKDAQQGSFNVSSFGKDNDIVLTANNAGETEGNYQVRYSTGSALGVAYSAPSGDTAGTINVTLETQQYTAASGTLDQDGVNDAFKITANVKGEEFNGVKLAFNHADSYGTTATVSYSHNSKTLTVNIGDNSTTADTVVDAINSAGSAVAALFTAEHVGESDGSGVLFASDTAIAVFNSATGSNGLQGGIDGGAILSTANDVIAEINKAITNGGAGEDVTASLAAGNDGHEVVSTFQEYAYFGSAPSNNRLQFLAPDGTRNVRFVANANQSLGIDVSTDSEVTAFSSATVQSTTADSTFTIAAKTAGEEFDGVQIIFNDNVSDDGTVVFDKEAGTLTFNIDTSARTAADLKGILEGDEYVSSLFTFEHFGDSTGGGTLADSILANGAAAASVVGTTSGGITSEGTLIVNLATNSNGTVTTTAQDLIDFFDDPSQFLSGSELTSAQATLADLGISISNIEGSDGSGLLAATTSDLVFASEGRTTTDAQAAATTTSIGGSTSQITFTAIESGAEFNDVQVRFEDGATAGSETFSYNSITKILTVGIDSGNSTATQVVAALSAAGNEDAAALFTAVKTDGTGAGTVDDSDTALLTGGVQITGTAAGASSLGNEDAGAGGLTFTATEHGSEAFVSVKALSGSFEVTDSEGTASERTTGTDVRARINGIQAIGRGLQAQLSTSALNLSFNVAETVTDNSTLSFSITGGGALFQLGPNVVSNQQARFGIQSVSTATLGGISGTLFELRSGGSSALNTDPTKAASIVDEVINAVTSLRGRLGAFQKTTLETNIFVLNDTLANLTDAESSIRDADFAAESARLTRAQILVQSGTSVLSIANQNPQNVLALLR